MVSESPARSSHRPPQPTILRLVYRLWLTLCRFIRQVFTDEIDPPEGFRPQSSDLMQKPLIFAGCDLGVIDEDRTRCLQDRERNGSLHIRPVILLLMWCIWLLPQSHDVYLLQLFQIAPHPEHSEWILCHVDFHHPLHLMGGPLEVWRMGMANVSVCMECIHMFWRTQME